MFLTPWGGAGRQNQLSFFDEFGCTILAPGKKIIIVKVHFQAVTVRPGGPEFSPGAMWYMVRDHDGYGDKKNPSTFVLDFKKIDSYAGTLMGSRHSLCHTSSDHVLLKNSARSGTGTRCSWR